MGIHLADQTVIFLRACIMGAVLGLLYDCFRISRIALPLGKVIIFVQDILFFCACAVVTFLFFLETVDGQVRGFLLVGEVLGATLYFFTLSLVVMGVSKTIIHIVESILRFLFRFLLYPVWRLFYTIVSLLLRPFVFLFKILKKYAQTQYFRLKVRRIVLYNQCKGYIRKRIRNRSARKQGSHATQTEKAQEP